MLRFAVFDQHGPAKAWPLVNAHLLGPDDLGVEGEIRFRDGEIRCKPRSAKATALCLQYDAGAAGVLMLQTCLLPDVDTPYVFSHELARHRIKTFIAKCEEWQMFELPAEHPAIVLWEQARHLFTQGLNHRDPIQRDRFGRQAIEKAVDATERLAMAHAEVLLHRRYGSKPASKTTLGVRVNTRLSPEPFADTLSKEFDLLYVPLHWRDLEPSEGTYAWDAADAWLSWAHKHGKPVVAGPLIDFSTRALPEWMHVWQHDYDTCRDMVYDHIERVVNRYRNAVSVWSIAAGLNTNENFQFTHEQMLDLTRMGSLLIRQGGTGLGGGGGSARRGKTMLEITHPFGEHAATKRDALSPFTYIDRLTSEGIRVDCYGLQLAFGSHSGPGPGASAGAGGMHARDLMQISHMMDRFFLLELPVMITACGVPSMASNEKGGTALGSLGSGWSAEMQARFASRAFPLAMSKPYVESFCWSMLADDAAEGAPHAGLFDASGAPKPALDRLIEIRRRMRKPLGALRAAAGAAAGAAGSRGDASRMRP
jgi:GH35 family endo-1,4-beta-xylanase